MNPDRRSTTKITTWLLLLAALVLIAYQASALYTTPRPDSDRWHGDETWLMREFHSQVTTGVMRYPEAEGATIGIRNNLLLSSMWLNAAVYGVPSAIFYPRLSEITIGRSVTLAIAILTLAALFLVSLRLGASADIAALFVLILAASRAFFLASHSARYDVWVGLGVLLAFYGARSLSRLTAIGAKAWALIGLVAAVLAVWNMHTLRIALILLPWLFIRTRAYRNKENWLSVMFGLAIGFVVLLGVYFIANGTLVDAFGLNTRTQFGQTTRDIPIMHPFSLLLYFANIHTRLTQFAGEAPFALVAICLAAVAGIALWTRDRRAGKPHSTAMLETAVLLALVWTITIRPLPYYLMHILPMLLCFSAIVLSAGADSVRGIGRSILLLLVGVAIVALGVKDASVAIANGRIVTASLGGIEDQLTKFVHQRVIDPPKMIAEVPLIDRMLLDRDVYLVAPYFLIFPKDSISPPAFLVNHWIRYVAVEGSRLILPSHFPLAEHGYVADSIGTLVSQWTGQFDDNHRDYFQPFGRWIDTVSLFEINAR